MIESCKMSMAFKLEKLYRDNFQTLVAFARSKGCLPDVAEEIVQDAFTRLNKYEAFDEMENEIAFLRTIIVNIIRDRFRRHKITPVLIDYEALNDELKSDAPGPEASHMSKTLLRQTMDDINELPEVTKHIFTAYRIQEKTYQQISQENNISISIVRRHLRDAIVHLTQRRERREQN